MKSFFLLIAVFLQNISSRKCQLVFYFSEAGREKKRREDLLSKANGKIFIDDIPGLRPEEAYRTDRKPDLNNFSYGCLYKTHVAKYRRLGAVCLGCDPSRPIYATDKIEKKLGQQKSILSRSVFIDEMGVKITSGDLKIEDYMSINDRKTEGSEVNPLNIYDATTEQYLLGRGGLQDVDPEPSERSVIDDTIGEYNRYLRDHPTDIDKWFEFVKFQDEFRKSNRRTIADAHEDMQARKVSEAFVIEKKLAILDKALTLNPNNVRLNVHRLELCSTVVEPDKLKSEWKAFVNTHLDNPAVWRSFIAHHQANLATFTVKDTMTIYGQCLTTLNKLKLRQLRSYVIPLDIEWDMVGK